MSRHMRAYLLVALLLVGACSSNSDNTGGMNPPPPPPPPASPQFLVRGAGMSGYNENLVVTLDGAVPINTAVTVNGDTISAAAGSSFYSGHLSTVVNEGGTVQVHVSNGTTTAIGTGILPAAPVVTAVQHGALGAPVTINWTSTTSPDSFTVYLDYHLSDSSTASVTKTVAGSARSVTLATTSIPANSVVTFAGVDAAMNGVFSGSIATGSNLHLRVVGGSFPVTIP